MTRNELSVTHVGGPTLLLDFGGLRLLTDPTFDQPGEFRPEGGSALVKLTSPAVTADDIEPVHGVLLSHDEHADNLDGGGRAMLDRVPLVLTTPEAEARLTSAGDVRPDRVRGLASWQSTEVAGPDGRSITVTGVPARHGPAGCESVTGTVTGFVVRGDGVPSVYVSGDNASLELVDEIADRFAPVDVAVLFAGRANTGLLDGADLTLSSEAAAEAARRLGAATVVGVHTEGWAHFTEGPDDLRAAFTKAGVADRLLVPEPGVRHLLEPDPARL